MAASMVTLGRALEDDGDDADGHANLGDGNAGGPRPLGELLPERLGQRADLAHAGDHGGERLLRDAQAIDERLAQAGLLRGGDVLRVGLEDGFLVALELGGDFVEHGVELGSRHSRERARGFAREKALVADLLFGGGERAHDRGLA